MGANNEETRGTYRGFHPQNLPVKHVTHVLYSFANVNAKDGTV